MMLDEIEIETKDTYHFLSLSKILIQKEVTDYRAIEKSKPKHDFILFFSQ